MKGRLFRKNNLITSHFREFIVKFNYQKSIEAAEGSSLNADHEKLMRIKRNFESLLRQIETTVALHNEVLIRIYDFCADQTPNAFIEGIQKVLINVLAIRTEMSSILYPSINPFAFSEDLAEAARRINALKKQEGFLKETDIMLQTFSIKFS